MDQVTIRLFVYCRKYRETMRSRALIRKHSGNFAFLNCIREDACFIIDKFCTRQTRSAGTKLALIKNIKLFLNSVPQQKLYSPRTNNVQ